MLHQCMRAYRRVNTYEHHMNCMSWRGEARPPSPSLIKNAFLSGLIGPLSSLHHAAGTWQEVLDVSDRRLGQVGHGAIAATGGAVVEKVADSGRRVLLEEIITGTEGFLGMKTYNRVNVREMKWHEYQDAQRRTAVWLPVWLDLLCSARPGCGPLLSQTYSFCTA